MNKPVKYTHRDSRGIPSLNRGVVVLTATYLIMWAIAFLTGRSVPLLKDIWTAPASMLWASLFAPLLIGVVIIIWTLMAEFHDRVRPTQLLGSQIFCGLASMINAIIIQLILMSNIANSIAFAIVFTLADAAAMIVAFLILIRYVLTHYRNHPKNPPWVR